MSTLPSRPDLEHLRKQAKQLLKSWRRRDPLVFQRLREHLPAARGKPDAALAALDLRLHDMQSCIAREQGFDSWPALKAHVELQQVKADSRDSLRLRWFQWIYGGDIAGGALRARPAIAARLLAERPDLAHADLIAACAIGNEAALRDAIAADRSCIDRNAGVLRIPPLIAITHGGLARLDSHREPLHRCLRLLLDAGANPDAYYNNRYPPDSLEQPGDERLTAIYGAAGKLHDPVMTRMLLDAGADPNDNESLYHSLEDPDRTLPCTRLLLAAGARVAGTNALARILDDDHFDGLMLLLSHTPRGSEDMNRLLGWALHRQRSGRHIQALLDAGADPHTRLHGGISTYKAAAMGGLSDVTALLEQAGVAEPLSDTERFLGACARADETDARALLRAQPSLIASLSDAEQRHLPLAAMAGLDDAVRLMVTLGWPIAARGGDIDGSALNWAVFRGNARLTAFLLDHGASWRERHGYDSDVLGTLSWASINEPRADGDWHGCTEALMAHGLPAAVRIDPIDPASPYVRIRIDGREMTYPDDVADVLLSAPSSR